MPTRSVPTKRPQAVAGTGSKSICWPSTPTSTWATKAAAEKLIETHRPAGEDRGEWYFARGLLAEKRDLRDAAIELYEKALTLDPDHAPAMFRAAWLYDLRGDDDRAIELYKRLAIQPRAHVNALVNLAVVYEDIGRFDDAIACLRRVLAAYPNHPRARLFLRDVESSREMVIDDAIEKQCRDAQPAPGNAHQ